MIINAGKEELDKELKEGVAILDFWAPWCGPCKQLGVTLDALDKEQDIKILKVNVDEHPELASEYGIMGVPALFFYKDGESVQRMSGAQSKEKIEAVLGEI